MASSKYPTTITIVECPIDDNHGRHEEQVTVDIYEPVDVQVSRLVKVGRVFCAATCLLAFGVESYLIISHFMFRGD